MQPVEVVKDIFWVGVNDHQTDLFEGLWPITQEGVSYNSYLVRDEKTPSSTWSKNHLQRNI